MILTSTPIVRVSYSAQPSKVVPAKRSATGTRETIYLDDDDEVWVCHVISRPNDKLLLSNNLPR
ncbi:BQ5605_C018g08734 [Microbotryum silenes-dioicae]|uniref:BQ5605_C018g08734 protein n=1 Tax=Microbotryum silenes-dioicae TaxID=796604 RepID=A0A2X0MRT9_9BASI|nr:BQ5605_C018g08734 [Microbotryum silenes-dioicae]